MIEIILSFLALCLIAYKFGVVTYPFLFSANVFLYLVFFPSILVFFNVINDGFNFTYLNNLISYVILMMVPIYFLNKWSFNQQSICFENDVSARKTGLMPKLIFLIIAISFVGYSIFTRNVFSGDGNLFTIIGFDLLLFYYYYFFSDRKSSINIILFFILFFLFLYAGFRYRLALLVLPAALVFYQKADIKRKIAIASSSIVFFVILMLFGQIRTYGQFMIDPSQINTNFQSIVAESGENIVSETTMIVMNNYSSVDPLLFEPYYVSVTHLIPSFLFPEKPRASYISIFSKFSSDYDGIGAAMHDIVQPTISGGPFFNHLFYLIHGIYFAFLIRTFYFFNKEKKHLKIMFVVLVGLVVPSRGYLPQQTLWLLTFIVPSILFWFSNVKKQKNSVYWPLR